MSDDCDGRVSISFEVFDAETKRYGDEVGGDGGDARARASGTHDADAGGDDSDGASDDELADTRGDSIDALVHAASELVDEDALAAEDQDDLMHEGGADVPAVSRKVAPRVRSRRVRPRSKTIAMKRLTRVELARGAEMYPPVEGVERPQTRAECRDGQRPCPWVACKHHLYLDINPRTGSIKINFPDVEPWELEHTCALDIADQGGLTLEEIGLVTNLTRERVRQVEVRGLLTLRARGGSLR